MPPTPPNSPLSVGGGASFETTHWSVVLHAGRGSEDALAKLCRKYWVPLYTYCRRRGHGFHEAQDLTQDFFSHILEKKGFASVTPTKGRFRSFLLTSLKHFLDNEWHRARTLKRGGGQQIVSWEELGPAEREAIEPTDPATAEKLFHRQWALTILSRVMNRIERECVAAKKGALFEKVKPHLVDLGDQSYAQIAAELGMAEGTVKVSVHRLRHRFGELVREEVSRTVANPADTEEEIRELFAALG